MPFKVYYQLFLRDKNGRLVRKSRKMRSRSFVLQWLQLLNVQMQQQAKNILDVTNTSKSKTTHTNMLQIEGAAGNDSRGIVVGTGTTSPTNADYCMETKIVHGSGAGELEYGAQAFVDPVDVAGNVDYVLSRTFVNGSGATITVNEIGIQHNIAFEFLMLRDVLPAGVDVLNAQTLTVQYTLRTTV